MLSANSDEPNHYAQSVEHRQRMGIGGGQQARDGEKGNEQCLS